MIRIYVLSYEEYSLKYRLVMCNRAGNYHGRGHGLQSLGGEVNQDELERKRLKTLEHQVTSMATIFNFKDFCHYFYYMYLNVCFTYMDYSHFNPVTPKI